MKRFIILSVLLFGCGDLGSSSSENSNVNNFNPEPVNCETTCFQNLETGEISVSSVCEGGFQAVTPPSVEECNSFIEVPAEPAEE